MASGTPPGGHAVANAACAARASSAGVYFEGGRIDALAVAAGEVLRTAEPEATRCGLAQVRRVVSTPALRLLHILFAPWRPRPLLLALVRLENPSSELVQVDYTELWEVPGAEIRAALGACECTTPDGVRALADAAAVIRGRAPEPLPRSGLALDVRFPLPPGESRQLAFAYAAPGPAEPAAPLVRAWRGDVAGELARTVRCWLERLGPRQNTIEAYRVEVSG